MAGKSTVYDPGDPSALAAHGNLVHEQVVGPSYCVNSPMQHCNFHQYWVENSTALSPLRSQAKGNRVAYNNIGLSLAKC